MKRDKSIRLAVGSLTLFAAGIMLAACHKDDNASGDPLPGGETISFGITSIDVQHEARSARQTGEASAHDFILRGNDPSDSLCMRATVIDGIARPSATRAAQVTAQTMTSFGVFASYSEGSESGYLMDNIKTERSGDVWATEQTYYWPGSDFMLDFHAYSPYGAVGVEFTHASEQDPGFDYTVPDDAANQSDLMVAQYNVPGNYHTAVPLAFKHICTAVQFKVGDQMAAGTIRSITLKNIAYKGSFDMATEKWKNDENSLRNFSLNEEQIKTSAVSGDAITEGDNTLMMLPQTLGADASIEVVCADANGGERSLSAPLVGEWSMGKTVVYSLSITPLYELEFTVDPEAQDAHYVIYPITIKSDDKLPAGGWTLTSDDPTNVTFVEKDKFVSNDVQALVDAGYWLDGHNGTSELTSTTTGEVQIYVFLKENATEADRNITLSLKPAAQGNYEAKEFSFTQYCPAWNNDIGVERIQDKDYPWGFNWDTDMKIVYSMPAGFWSGITHILFEIFGNHSYKSDGMALAGTWKVTVDFSKVPKLTTATSSDDGHKNTWELYNFDGISEASTIMNQLESWGGVPDKTLPTNPTEFAARACAMKNKYRVETKTNQGETVYNPVLNQADMVWYLPAQNEAPLMNDNLSGDYWTSTAITDPGTTAYKYTARGSISAEDRNSVIHVRAVRQKP